jgi:hypothetical protein
MAMQTVMTAVTVTAGMIFSLAVAIAVEEVIFGQVFRVFHARQAAQTRTGQRR